MPSFCCRQFTKQLRGRILGGVAICRCLCLLSAAGVAAAQAPLLTSMMPVGGPRGGVTAVHVSGANLRGAKILASGTGVSALSVTSSANGDSAEVKLSIAANAALGEREIRIATPDGVSGPQSIWVDVYPNLAEEANVQAGQARRMEKSPLVVNGTIREPAGRDAFGVDMGPGETWVIDANVARIHSPLNPSVVMVDEAGRVVAEGRAAEGGDPRIVYRCEHAGRFTVSISDRDKKGGPDFAYRLTIGRLPVVTGVSPHGEKPGRKVAVKLTGANLGPVARTIVTIPADAPAGLFWTTVRTSAGLSLPFPLLVDYAPVVGLTETDALIPLPTLPCALEGSFIVYPSIRFAFQANPKNTLLFDLFTHSIGSEAEGLLRITDMGGKELSASASGSNDPHVEFTPSADGVYVVEARDSTGKLGAGHSFRLSARIAEPDFRVFVDADRVTLPQGSAARITIEVERLSGFDGPIQLGSTGLPRGVTLAGATIAAGQTSTELTFAAPINSPPATTLVTITGSAQTGSKRISHHAIARVKLSGGAGWRTCELLPISVLAPQR